MPDLVNVETTVQEPPAFQQYKDLERSVEEYKAKYDRVNTEYSNLQTKILGLLAAQLAVATFLYSQDGFMPKERYGAVLFWAATIGFAASIIISVWSTHSSTWQSPPGKATLNKRTREKFIGLAFLELLLDDYRDAFASSSDNLAKKARNFDYSLLLFVVTSAILIVIKFFK